MTSSEMTPADIAAVTGNNDGMGFGGNGAWWLIVLFLFAFMGWGGRGAFGGGTSGADPNYVLVSDFAQVESKLDTVNAGLCDGFYAMNTGMLNGFSNTSMAIMQGTNTLASQLADCCCKTQSGLERVNTNMAINANALSRDIERGFCDTNFNNQAAHTQTMQAIDKVGDRIIDYLNQSETQKLRDQLAGYRERENSLFVINQLRPMPVPAYPSCNPWAASYGYGNNGCSNAC